MSEHVALHSIVTNGIVHKDGKILIGKRSHEEEHEPNKWTVPGGKVEYTDGDIWNVLEDNVRKEIEEEVGVLVKNIQLLSNNTFYRAQGQHSVAIQYLCEWESGEADALDETVEICWIGPEEVASFEFPPNVDTYIYQAFEKLGMNLK